MLSSPSHHLLLLAATSLATAFLSAALRLPSLLLHGLHTYIHPDSPGADSLRAVLRRPSGADSSSDPKRRSRSSANRLPGFDDANAQLLRLRLSDSDLRTRVLFPSFRAAFISSAVALADLTVPRVLLTPDPSRVAAISAAAAALATAHILILLSSLSLQRSASKRSERQLSSISGCIGFLSALAIVFFFSPSIFDFELGAGDAGAAKTIVSVLAGTLSWLLFMPASRAARSFWLGTDQLRWNLAVVSCGVINKILLFVTVIAGAAAPLLWVIPVAVVPAGGEIGSVGFREFRVWAMMASAVLQLLVLRPNVQMYLNEAVVSWYQRLHASRALDMDYGRAKVFLHNHYLCLVVLQFFAPPVMVLLLLGLSQIRGDLFSGLFSLVIPWLVFFVQSLLFNPTYCPRFNSS